MTKKQKRIGTIDCETPPFLYGRDDLVPFVWGLYLDDHFRYFWGDDCTIQLMEYLQDEEDVILYVHNGGKFDIFFLLEYLDPELLIINGRISKSTLFDGKIEIRDSWNILPLPLSAYNKDDFDYDKNESENRGRYKDEIISYLKSDCYYLYNWVNDFINQFGLNLTLAATSFKQLKGTGYEIHRTYADYDAQFRPFYYGGRVQCFDVGTFMGNYKYIDINSAYPHAMCEPHWYGPQNVEKLRLSDKILNGSGSFFVDFVGKSYGAVPYRCKNAGKLLFPDDGVSRRYKCSGWEIQSGLKTGTLKIEKINRVYVPLFKKSFSEYVSKFFKVKSGAEKIGDRSKYLIAKLILNSPSGKFGQDGSKFEDFCILPFGEWPKNNPKWSHDQRWTPYSNGPNNTWMFSRPNPEMRYYNVSTSASITGYVRASLWEAICDSDDVLYCDTDSIICRDSRCSISKDLGDWDLEATFNQIHVAQRKMYAGSIYKKEHPFVEYKVASKGVRFSDTPEKSYHIIRRAISKKSSVTVKKDAPAFSLKYGMRYFDKTIDFKNIRKNACNNPV